MTHMFVINVDMIIQKKNKMPLPKQVKPTLPLVPKKTLLSRREELLEYIEYLVYKFHKDEDLSDDQKRVILRGLEDIKYGRSHLNEITETE